MIKIYQIAVETIKSTVCDKQWSHKQREYKKSSVA